MSSEPVQSALTAFDIARINGFLIATAVNFLVLGLYTTLTCIALYYLCTKKGAPAARMILIVVTIIMFICSTVGLVEHLVWYTVDMSTLGFNPPNVDDTLIKLQITLNGFIRVTVLLSDGIVIWRAWVLWNESRTVHLILSFCMFISFAGICTDYTFIVLFSLGDSKLAPVGPKTLILTLPTLCANIISTSLIGYKIWLYRREIKHDLNISPNKKTRVEKIMILLMESGVIYGVLWILGMSIVPNMDIESPTYNIISGMWPQVTALYPIFITLLVSMEKMQLEHTVDLPTVSMPIHFASTPRASGGRGVRTGAGINTNIPSIHSDIEQGTEDHEMAVAKKSTSPSILT